MNQTSPDGESDETTVCLLRILAAVARRTGDPQYARALTLDVYRAASVRDQGNGPPTFGALLATALEAARNAARSMDLAAVREASDAGAIASLRPSDREILRLVYWDHVSMAELADFLDCSMAEAGLRLDRAYRRAERRLRRAADQSAEPKSTQVPQTQLKKWIG